jgi:hypothetical protein
MTHKTTISGLEFLKFAKKTKNSEIFLVHLGKSYIWAKLRDVRYAFLHFWTINMHFLQCLSCFSTISKIIYVDQNISNISKKQKGKKLLGIENRDVRYAKNGRFSFSLFQPQMSIQLNDQ